MNSRLAFAFVAFSFALVTSQAGELTETQKRAEFVKAYASAKPEDRVAAVQLLKGTKEPTSKSFLTRVASTDLEPSVRLAAFLLISDWEDTQGKLEPVVLELFRNEKNRANKISMLQTFPKLKTKAAATEEAIKFFCTFTYPATYEGGGGNDGGDGGGGGGGGGPATGRRSKEEIEALRKDFSDVLAVVNTLTGQSFPTSEKAHEQSKKWWALNKGDFLKADAAMLIKLRDEAQAASKQATTETKQ